MQTILEATMLITFSAGWYMSVAKMLCTGVAAGKSSSFVALVCLGYGAGIGAKWIEGTTTGALDPVIWLYCWNLLVCLFDLALVIHLTRRAQATRPKGDLQPG